MPVRDVAINLLRALPALALGACTSAKEPAPQTGGASPEVAVAAPMKAEGVIAASAGSEGAAPSSPEVGEPTTPVNIAADVDADPNAAAKTWWCLCYARTAGDAAEPLTACRSSESECRALQKRVKRGGRGIVAGSLSRGCIDISAAHPGDALGGREVWEASRRPGAWLSAGACRIDDGGDVDDARDDGGDADEADELARMEKVLSTESLGPLKPGMSAAEVIAAVGEPTKREKIWEEGATGSFVQTWRYDQGLQLEMISETRKGPQSVSGITIAAPSTYKTARGVGLGTPREEAAKIYRDVLEEAIADNEENLTAGSLYGGLFMAFEGAGVATIYLGRGAE
ncbi:MAG: hypothetical protein H6711_34780 [Myxococcales bacterium]|nr:hypothetical protein [Myxococcales bacterium]